MVEQINQVSPWVSAIAESYNELLIKGSPSADIVSKRGSFVFPTRRDEYWKYTSTKGIERTKWAFAKSESEEGLELPKFLKGSTCMVFVNGILSDELSDLSNIKEFLTSSKSSLNQISEDNPFNPLVQLNDRFPQESFAIKIPKNRVVQDVLNIVHLYNGENIISQPKSSIILSEGSNIKVNEFHLHSEKTTFSNARTEIKMEKNSTLGLDIIQEGGNASFSHYQIETEINRDCNYTQNTFSLSGGWIRNNTIVKIEGENSEANLNGIYLPSGKEHIDNHTIVDHKIAHCQSNELYRGVLMDKSSGVFNGKVYVRQDAQKTNAFQSNGNVLLSDSTTMNSKPELEIYADDVKCSHGSTTGQMDEDALFYLMARGLSKESAKRLLVMAFSEDVLNSLVNPSLRDYLETAIKNKLNSASNES